MIVLNTTDLWRFQLKTSTSYLHNWYKIKPDTRENYIFLPFLEYLLKAVMQMIKLIKSSTEGKLQPFIDK